MRQVEQIEMNKKTVTRESDRERNGETMQRKETEKKGIKGRDRETEEGEMMRV